MSTTELRKRLIEKIQATHDSNLLEEAYRLLQGAEDTGVYRLSDEQKALVNEAKEQIKKGKSLTNEQSDNEIDEWLSK